MKKEIDIQLVEKLVRSQFPKWNSHPIKPVQLSGTGNYSFRLGDSMIIRLPRTPRHAQQVEKEYTWLPKIKSYLPLPIPEVLGVGKPGEGYPWNWVIYNWFEGEPLASSPVSDLKLLAEDLAHFFSKLHNIDFKEGPLPGIQGSNRGGPLTDHDLEMRAGIATLKKRMDVSKVVAIWEKALKAPKQTTPIWIHGDVSSSNILVQNGRLSAVIDFGQLTRGDPAYDFACAWIFLDKEARRHFRKILNIDDDTWARSHAWGLRRTVVHAAGLKVKRKTIEATECWKLLEKAVEDE